jgi:hypothetical protein
MVSRQVTDNLKPFGSEFLLTIDPEELAGMQWSPHDWQATDK